MDVLETTLRVRPQFYVTELQVTLAADGFPQGCDVNGKKVWTEQYGLGWRFGIGRDDGHSQDIDIFFDPVLWDPPKGAQVLVARSTRAEHFNTNWTVWSTLNGRDVRRVVSFERSSITEKPIIRFAVCVGTDEPEEGATFPVLPLRTALNTSLGTGAFVDTRFHVFSKRVDGGGACEPRLVFASSTPLKLQSEYFQGLFDDTFGKNDPPESSIDHYEYSSDSDLEEDSNTDPDDDALSHSIVNLSKEPLASKEGTHDKEPTALKDGSISKSDNAEPTSKAAQDTEKGEGSAEKAVVEGSSSSAQDTGGVVEGAGGSMVTAEKKDLPESSHQAVTVTVEEKGKAPAKSEVEVEASSSSPSTNIAESATILDSLGPLVPTEALRQVYVRDCAYTTWRALIFYLYTGHIAFCPLRSSFPSPPLPPSTSPTSSSPPSSRADFIANYLTAHPGHPAPVSPKSVYRLADKLGLRALERIALEELKGALTVDNCVREYFSNFTAKYEKVQTLELNFMQRNSSIEAVEQALKDKQGEIFQKHPQLLFAAFTKLLKR